LEEIGGKASFQPSNLPTLQLFTLTTTWLKQIPHPTWPESTGLFAYFGDWDDKKLSNASGLSGR
jgi:hypothetical protein